MPNFKTVLTPNIQLFAEGDPGNEPNTDPAVTYPQKPAYRNRPSKKRRGRKAKMDWLKEILGEAHTDDIDKRVSDYIGKNFVSKADFTIKNDAVKELTRQFGGDTFLFSTFFGFCGCGSCNNIEA